MAFEDDAAHFVGQWIDSDKDFHQIATADQAFTIKAWCGSDGEVFEVRDVRWTPGLLRWTVRVPSTGYLLDYRARPADAGHLQVRWKNADALNKASGKELFTRLK